MTTRATLSGSVTLGGGTVLFSAAVGGGPLALKGALRPGDSIDFTALINQIAGAGYLQLPDGFPTLAFDTASFILTPSGQTGSGLSATAGSSKAWVNPLGILKGTI